MKIINKSTIEAVRLEYAWSKRLAAGEGISASVWSESTGDISIADDGINHHFKRSYAVIGGGLNNTEYKVTNTVATDEGQTLTQSWYLWVSDDVSPPQFNIWRYIPQVTSAVATNIAIFDSFGNVVDSGSKISDISAGTPTVTGTPSNMVMISPANQAQDSGVPLSDIARKSDFDDVATSGDYNDLDNTPSLASIATDPDYGNLTNTPSIPEAGYPIGPSLDIDGGVAISSRRGAYFSNSISVKKEFHHGSLVVFDGDSSVDVDLPLISSLSGSFFCRISNRSDGNTVSIRSQSPNTINRKYSIFVIYAGESVDIALTDSNDFAIG